MEDLEKLRRVKPGFKLRFNIDDQGLIGPTGRDILRYVLLGYPLTKVADKLDLSYRFVWGYINKIEKRCHVDIVETRRGAAGGTKIRPCGTVLYYIYEQLRKILECAVNCYEKILIEGPLRDTLIVENGYIFGLLDVIGEVDPGDEIVIPPLKNSYRVPLRFYPKVYKKRIIDGVVVTTVAIREKVNLPEGKIRIDPLSIGICKK